MPGCCQRQHPHRDVTAIVVRGERRQDLLGGPAGLRQQRCDAALAAHEVDHRLVLVLPAGQHNVGAFEGHFGRGERVRGQGEAGVPDACGADELGPRGLVPVRDAAVTDDPAGECEPDAAAQDPVGPDRAAELREQLGECGVDRFAEAVTGVAGRLCCGMGGHCRLVLHEPDRAVPQWPVCYR